MIVLTFTDLSTDTITLPGLGLTRYNNRVGLPASDLLAWVAQQLTALDGVGEFWTDDEPTGDYIGRPQLVNDHPRADGKTLDTVEFLSGLTSTDLGFHASVMTSTVSPAGDQEIIGDWLRGRLWIPQSDGFLALDERTREETVVITTSPDGTNTRDFYGGLDIRTTELLTVAAALVWPQYAQDTAFVVGVSGMTAGDLNAPLDTFRQVWRDSALPVRYSADLTAPGTFVELEMVDDWAGNLAAAVTPIGRAPRLYTVRLTALEV